MLFFTVSFCELAELELSAKIIFFTNYRARILQKLFHRLSTIKQPSSSCHLVLLFRISRQVLLLLLLLLTPSSSSSFSPYPSPPSTSPSLLLRARHFSSGASSSLPGASPSIPRSAAVFPLPFSLAFFSVRCEPDDSLFYRCLAIFCRARTGLRKPRAQYPAICPLPFGIFSGSQIVFFVCDVGGVGRLSPASASAVKDNREIFQWLFDGAINWSDRLWLWRFSPVCAAGSSRGGSLRPAEDNRLPDQTTSAGLFMK